MDNSKTEILQRLKDANNVLVTVSQNPTVDQLAAAIGMTLVLNKMGKHGTAVFSGSAPSTIEFLKPEETLEKNTDSLRDFIIALDKSKADKLRYKVEDQHVKIFITPYRTTISEGDLEFSHGDFNVDVVLALGVHVRQDLDQAITAHGRILHDATLISVNLQGQGELGVINLTSPDSSSLSEVMAEMSNELQADIFDTQIATAFLTGIVAETERFSNEKTKPSTMSLSAKLMAAGANQQLVATKLEEPVAPVEPPAPVVNDEEELAYSTGEATQEPKEQTASDGSLAIDHSADEPVEQSTPEETSEGPAPEQLTQEELNKIHIDEHGNVQNHDDVFTPAADEPKTDEPKTEEPDADSREGSFSRSRLVEPPTHTGTLTASGKDELDPSTDPLSNVSYNGPILTHGKSDSQSKEDGSAPDTPVSSEEAPKEDAEPVELPEPQPLSPPAEEPQLGKARDELRQVLDEPIADTQTLDDLEKAVDSPHQEQKGTENPEGQTATESSTEIPDLNELQSAVDQALVDHADDKPLEPIAALNANPVDLDLGHEAEDAAPQTQEATPSVGDEYLDISQLEVTTPEASGPSQDVAPSTPPEPSEERPASATVVNPDAPPPVPPPMMPPNMMNPESDDDITLPPVPQ